MSAEKFVRLVALFLLLARYLLTPSQLAAQVRSPAALDVTVGLHKVAGGLIDSRTGAMADVLATGRVRMLPGRALVAGVGASAVVGGFGDLCLITPTGGCAGKGNFTVLNMLIGVDQPIGIASARLLVGPAVYDGAGARWIGLQGRVDAVTSPLGHVALGAMGRATLLPSHNSQALLAYALGVTLALR